MFLKEIEKREFVQRIPSHYVGDDCVQIMAGYRGSMVLLNPKGILYCDLGGYDFIHQYSGDERRKQFPYSNIPTHYRKIGLRKYKLANHLLDFDTPYLKISPQGTTEIFAVKDGKQALVVTKVNLAGREQTRYLTRKELEDLFTQPTIESNTKVILDGGDVCGTLVMPSDDQLVRWYREGVKDNLFSIIKETNRPFDRTYGLFETLINNIGIEDIPEGFPVIDTAFIIDMDSKDITMKKVSVSFMAPDRYKVVAYPIPINRYTLEQLNGAVKIYDNTKNEPKINPRLNPGISIGEIEIAKQLVIERTRLI